MRTNFKLGFTLMVFSFLVFSACTDSRQKQLDMIEAEEQKIAQAINAPLDVEVAKRLIDLYTDFIANFPSDTLSPKYLFKIGEIQMNIGENQLAINSLDSLIHNYPLVDLVPQAIYLQGFIWEDRIHSTEKAKIAFESLIERFPDHELSENAKLYIQVLGKSPEDLIKEFEKADSSAITSQN
ncbi:MAG: tetratricopeptide repeat protein [Bacteroidales bacterium]|nr:tetratricopeptide repeat protein [Bacteroidales bacterium]